MRRSTLALAFLLVVCSLAGAGRASAWTAAGRAWPGTTIPYVDLTGAGGYHGAIARAVSAWNAAGLGIRFAPARSAAASVQLVYRPGRCLAAQAGSASTGFRAGTSRVVLSSCPAVMRSLLVAHELGRVLGLGTEDDVCSLMNSTGISDGLTLALPGRCSPATPLTWLPGLIDPDTLAGARTMYAAPAAPTDVALTPGLQPRIEWRLRAPATGTRVAVVRASGRCPSDRDVALGGSPTVYGAIGYAGLHAATDATFPAVQGTYCYGVFAVNRYGRASRGAFLPFVFGQPPVAQFAVSSSSPTVGAPVTFTDASTDAEGQIVHWRWDFGDPSSGAANVVDTADPTVGRTVQHAFAAPGAYTVSLTVADDAGGSNTATQQLTVVAGRP